MKNEREKNTRKKNNIIDVKNDKKIKKKKI